MDSNWWLADGHISGLVPQDKLHIFWHRDGILAFFPILGDRFRVIGDLGLATGNERGADPTLEEINAMLALRATPGVVLSNPFWLSSFRINERKVKNYSKGRAFLAGDAAHIHSPAGGQGMNTGMQAACSLASKPALVPAGSARPSLPDSYSPARSPGGGPVLTKAGRLTEAAIVRNPV